MSNQAIGSDFPVLDGLASERRLLKSQTNESSIDKERNPRSFAEQDSIDKQTHEQNKLKVTDQSSELVVVVVHKRLDLCRGTGGSRLAESRKKVSAGVGQNMEEGVNRKRRKSDQQRLRDKPEQGNNEVLHVVIANYGGHGRGTRAVRPVEHDTVGTNDR